MTVPTRVVLGVFALVFMLAPAAAHAEPDATAKEKPPAKSAPRTLEDINIAGDIPVPQVLFFSARDQRRVLSFNHHRYIESSLQIGRGTVHPRWIALTRHAPTAPEETTP